MKTSGRRVLAIVTDAYGGYGGVAAYNRDVLQGMAEDPSIGEVVCVPRVAQPPLGDLPAKLHFDLSGLGGGWAFVKTCVAHARRGKFDLVYCGHINLVPVAVLLSKITRAPWVLCLYGVEGWSRSPRKLVAALAGKADHYLPLSQVTLDRFRELYPVPDSKATVMPNAVHLEQFGVGEKPAYLLDRYGLRDKPTVMTFGRLNASEKAKGFDRMIELLPRLVETIPDVRYLICGQGDDRGRLEALAAKNGVTDRVIFAGLIDEAEKADHYRLVDVYAMPSVLEGFGFVFIEAMACGIPVVASSIDGGREAVRLGELGAMVDPFDQDALLAAIREAFAKPRQIPAELEFFAFANFKRRLMDALQPLLARSKS